MESIKEKLIERISANNNERLLQEIYHFLDEKEKAPIQFSEEEAKIIQESLEDYKSGKVIPHEEMEKRMDEWLKE